MLILWFIVVFTLIHKGNTQANCDASERTVLKCNFPRNVNATQTDFAVYFKFDDGYEELLVDCVWLNHELQCLQQEGFDVKPQVSETADISLPTRFARANGTFKCNLEGLEHKQGIPCRSNEKRQDKQDKIQSNQFGGSIPGNNPNDKRESTENHIPLIAGVVSGAAIFFCIAGLMIMAMYKGVKKRNTALRARFAMKHNVSFINNEDENQGADKCCVDHY